MKVGIIGGGASGILCAILIKSNNPKIDVTILEQNDRIGKKLLQTGNGCCNLDNVNSSDYHKYNTPLIKELISKYDYKFIMRLFNDLGLACMIDDEGRIYPYSKKATNVLDILLANLSINSVNVKTGIEVKDIKKINNQFIVNSEFVFDDLVLSCGGKEVGNLLNKDIDEGIIKVIEMPISDYFAKYGEEQFRFVESAVIKTLAVDQGKVIATGGGSILKPENVKNLKQNGRLYFLDRSLDKLITPSDRPLSSDRDALKKRYEERIDIYRRVADVVIPGDNSVEEVVNNILKEVNK